MSHHVAGALGSKWGNPFKAKKTNKKSVNKCLKRYEDHVRKNPDLFNAVMELEGKELGCWCKPFRCHGDILIKLFKERHDASPCPSRSDHKFTPVSACQTLMEQAVISESESGPDSTGSEPPGRTDNFHLDPVLGNERLEKDNNEVIPLASSSQGSHNRSNHAPLRLTGGGDTSFSSQENENLEHQANDLQNSMSEQDIRDILFETGYTIEEINDIFAAKVMAELDNISNSTLSSE